MKAAIETTDRSEPPYPPTETETETATDAMKRVFKSMPDRASHLSFFHNEVRDWFSVKKFWSTVMSRNNIRAAEEDAKGTTAMTQTSLDMSDKSLPQWMRGSCQYGLTDISAIHECGAEEFLGYHSRGDKKKGNKRKTFALRIGYDGSRYQGYQSQGASNTDIVTVEEDVKKALRGMSSMSAGRTDKDVSAVSQVISCHTFDQSVTPQSLRRSFAETAAVREGRLTLFDCAIVPKKFHALFSATWRRYLYLFPLNIRRKPSSESVQESSLDADPPVRWFTLKRSSVVTNDGSVNRSSAGDTKFDFDVDIDIDHVNALLASLEGKELSYNGFAYKDIQKTNRGALANRGGGARGKDGTTAKKSMDSTEGEEVKASVDDVTRDEDTRQQSHVHAHNGEQFGSRPESKMRYTPLDKCTLHKASAYMVDIQQYLQGTDSSSKGEGGEKEGLEEKLVMCVELVGSRFLRRMVRILVATAIRECQLPAEERDQDVLLKICELGLRDRSSMAISGEGLAIAGVGYDLASLSIPKFGTTTTNPKKLKKKALKRALAEKDDRELEEKKAKMATSSSLGDTSLLETLTRQY